MDSHKFSIETLHGNQFANHCWIVNSLSLWFARVHIMPPIPIPIPAQVHRQCQCQCRCRCQSQCQSQYMDLMPNPKPRSGGARTRLSSATHKGQTQKCSKIYVHPNVNHGIDTFLLYHPWPKAHKLCERTQRGLNRHIYYFLFPYYEVPWVPYEFFVVRLCGVRRDGCHQTSHLKGKYFQIFWGMIMIVVSVLSINCCSTIRKNVQ